MLRSIVAAMCAVLAVAAPSSGAANDDRASSRSTYIVVLKPDTVRSVVPALAGELARSHDGTVASVYQHALRRGGSTGATSAICRSRARTPTTRPGRASTRT